MEGESSSLKATMVWGFLQLHGYRYTSTPTLSSLSHIIFSLFSIYIYFLLLLFILFYFIIYIYANTQYILFLFLVSFPFYDIHVKGHKCPRKVKN